MKYYTENGAKREKNVVSFTMLYSNFNNILAITNELCYHFYVLKMKHYQTHAEGIAARGRMHSPIR